MLSLMGVVVFLSIKFAERNPACNFRSRPGDAGYPLLLPSQQQEPLGSAVTSLDEQQSSPFVVPLYLYLFFLFDASSFLFLVMVLLS